MRRQVLSSVPLAAFAAVLTLSVGDSIAQSTNVDVGNYYFCNSSFESGVCDTTVTAGSTVTWQVSAGFHTVTECDASFTTCPPGGGFDSGQLTSGGTFAQTFTTPGTVSYWCSFHSDQMRGRIVVQAQATPTPTPAVTASPAAGSTTATPQTATPGQATRTPTPAGIPSSGGDQGAGTPGPAAAALVALGALSLTAAMASVVALRRRVG